VTSQIVEKNITYKLSQINKYYSNKRQKWGGFYKSEKWVFERIKVKKSRWERFSMWVAPVVTS
jgi:hypothetical protein